MKACTFGLFYMPQICDMGRRVENFFALKNPTASAGFVPANLGTKDQHGPVRTNTSKVESLRRIFEW